MTSILQSEKYIEKCMDVWLEQLGEIADRKGSFEMWTWARMGVRISYAYDIIGELYFSKMWLPTIWRRPFGLHRRRGRPHPRANSEATWKALGSLTDATNGMLKARLAALQDPNYAQQSQRADILGKLLDISHKNGKELDFVLDNIKMVSFGAFLPPLQLQIDEQTDATIIVQLQMGEFIDPETSAINQPEINPDNDTNSLVY
ncbi:hypothetical protein BDV12DRAFT_193507 [Aspergillus spectabilis]